MIQRSRKLPLLLRILVYAAAAVAVLAVAAGVGVVAALMLRPDEASLEGATPGRAERAKPEQAGKQENAPEQGASDRSRKAEYLGAIADIQNGSVEASLDSNEKLLRYDALTSDDIEQMRADYEALGDYNDQVKDLDPPQEHEDQYELFVLAIDELYTANGIAYRLAAEPASATQAEFEAYDRHVQKATTYLQRSNKTLGEDYKTTETAREVSFG